MYHAQFRKYTNDFELIFSITLSTFSWIFLQHSKYFCKVLSVPSSECDKILFCSYWFPVTSKFTHKISFIRKLQGIMFMLFVLRIITRSEHDFLYRMFVSPKEICDDLIWYILSKPLFATHSYFVRKSLCGWTLPALIH